jgi:hypothetical protein
MKILPPQMCQKLAILIFSSSIAVLCTGSLHAGEGYELSQDLKATAVLPKTFFESDLYNVDQKVKNDGLMNTYTVTSKHGNFEVISTVALYKLIVEIEAIDAMKKVEESDTFTKSLKKSGANTVEGVKNLFSDPEESIEGAGKGLASLFSRAGESIFQSSPGATEDSRTKQLIGFSKSKREIAFKYHVDVYSTNKVLQEQLDTLAWADYGGGITLSIATLPLGGPAKVVYSSSNAVRLLNEAIAMTPPSELKKQNREKLAKMKIDPNLSDLFINNPHFSPRQQTYIVAALEAMSEAAHREVALMVGLQVKDSDMAMAITTIAMMQAGYNNNVAKIKGLDSAMRIMGGRDANGNQILLIPVDYLTWNNRLAGVLEALNKESGSSKGQIWLLGTASELAQVKLKERGWQVHTKIAGKIGINEIGLLKKKGQ